MCSTRCSQKYDVFMSLSPFYTVYICHDEVCLLRFIRPNSSLSSQLRATCPWKSCFKHKWQLLLEFEGISLQLIIFVDTVLLSCSITETLTHSAALCLYECLPAQLGLADMKVHLHHHRKIGEKISRSGLSAIFYTAKHIIFASNKTKNQTCVAITVLAVLT